jgi:hypothetical protein
MGKMKTYFAGKLFDINYRMAVHEGDANRRLASEAARILLLPPSEVPKSFAKKFDRLRELIRDTLKHLPQSGMTPSKMRGIYNATAAKYIKLLIDIYDYVEHH